MPCQLASQTIMMPNRDSENEKEDVKLNGKVDVVEVHRIINTEPTKRKDETYIQRKVREAAETAMEFTNFHTTANITGECEVDFNNRLKTITKSMKNHSTAKADTQNPRKYVSVVTVQHEDWDSIQESYEKMYHNVFVDDTMYIPTVFRALRIQNH